MISIPLQTVQTAFYYLRMARSVNRVAEHIARVFIKKYFESDIFEAERIRVEKEVRIHALLRDGKWKEAKNIL